MTTNIASTMDLPASQDLVALGQMLEAVVQPAGEPLPIDWAAVAAQVTANDEATGFWFYV